MLYTIIFSRVTHKCVFGGQTAPYFNAAKASDILRRASRILSSLVA